MTELFAVAEGSFSRIAKMRGLYLILFICILDVAAMGLYGPLSMGMEKELMFDAALMLSLVVSLVTAMAAAYEIPRELREHTAEHILTRPGGRNAFVWGKFFGISALVIFNVLIMAVGSFFVYRSNFNESPWHMAPGIVLIMAEGITLTGVAIALSVFLSESLAALGVFIIYAIGHSLFALSNSTPSLAYVANVLPNFHLLDVKTELSHAVEVSWTYVGIGSGYAVAYGLALAALGVVLFSRKDL